MLNKWMVAGIITGVTGQLPVMGSIGVGRTWPNSAVFAFLDNALAWFNHAGLSWTLDIIGVGLLLAVGWCQWINRQHRSEDRRLRQQLIQEEQALADATDFSARLIAFQESERKRIAQEMHDSLGQDLLVIKNFAMLGVKTRHGSCEASERFRDIAEVASTALKKVRQITYNLRPEELDRLGLTLAIRAMVDRAAESISTRFSLELDDVDGLLPSDMEINFYRVVQEGINNILKHSRANCACVVLKKENGAIHLYIRDDGQGFENNRCFGTKPENRTGLGFAGMNKRVRLLGGQLEVHSQAGEGVTLQARVPYQTNGASHSSIAARF